MTGQAKKWCCVHAVLLWYIAVCVTALVLDALGAPLRVAGGFGVIGALILAWTERRKGEQL
jgi:predicted outer membrane lipoprotein